MCGFGQLANIYIVFLRSYYEYIWQRNKGVSFSSLFQGMPISLQADISLSLYKKIIDQVPLFQNTEIGFTKLLALSIKPVLFLSKEYVVRKGDIGSEVSSQHLFLANFILNFIIHLLFSCRCFSSTVAP